MKAVIFDLGNVLVDYDHQRTLNALASVSDLSITEMAALFREVSHAAGIGQLDAQELYEHLVRAAQLTRHFDQITFDQFVDLFAAGISRNETAIAYALSLQQRTGVTVAVISNTNGAHVRWLDQHVPELAQLDLVMMSNEVGMLKPDPAIFHLALDLLELPAAHCLFVDDLAENVAAAQNEGMFGITHTDWSTTRPTLERWLTQDAPFQST